MHMPFYTADLDEKYWVGFCLRGGRGINYNGVTVSDPASLMVVKPDVNHECILDKEHVPTVTVTSPINVNTRALSPEQTEISWETNPRADEDIVRYRIFISEKDSMGSTLNFETNDDSTSYVLKTPRSMWGKDYVLSVQSINSHRQISMKSEPAIFKVANYGKSKATVNSETHPTITNIKPVLATPDKIILAWLENADAAVYRIKWDKGDSKKGMVDLIEVPAGTVYLTSSNTQGVIGSSELRKNGGTFTFTIQYVHKKLGKLSEPSEPVKVVVKPIQ